MRPESRPISSYLRNSPPSFEARAFLSDETEKADAGSSPKSGHLQCTSAPHRIAGYPGSIFNTHDTACLIVLPAWRPVLRLQTTARDRRGEPPAVPSCFPGILEDPPWA